MEKKKSNQLRKHKKPEWKTTRSLDFKSKEVRVREQRDMDPFLHFGGAQKVEW